jgi:hypothetical protein
VKLAAIGLALALLVGFVAGVACCAEADRREAAAVG